ncbi:MAG: hypothetical protein AMXMBFR7_10250 [Planctomycetota bacterium]
MSRKRVLLPATAALIVWAASAIGAADVPTGASHFSVTRYLSGIPGIMAFTFTPDGRMLLCEKGGRLRVVKNGKLLAAPFATFAVDTTFERGLLGVVCAPDFAVSGHVYMHYSVKLPVPHNIIARVTADGDRAVLGSELRIFDLEPPQAANHNGGALRFGPDGKLYVGVGDDSRPETSARLDTIFGKLLRINPDGSIPEDNPFFTTATGLNRAIWAYGLRNPYSFSFQPGTGRLFINDVGQDAWEEIDEGVAGSNYGWPTFEGPFGDAETKQPIFSYPHSQGCAIVGGVFYNPPAPTFPPEHVGRYAYLDFCSGKVFMLDLETFQAQVVAQGFTPASDLQLGPDGALYVACVYEGAIYRIQYEPGLAPAIVEEPQDLALPQNRQAVFEIAASGAPRMNYRWYRDDRPVGNSSPRLEIGGLKLGDSGSRIRCVVRNAFGAVASRDAILTVLPPNLPPSLILDAPAKGLKYAGGDAVPFAAHAVDPEEGALAPEAFTWNVWFHHDSHRHPFLTDLDGIDSGVATVPTEGESSANVWIRFEVTVRDAAENTVTVTRDIYPRKAYLTLGTQPAQRTLALDGSALPRTPAKILGVVNLDRTLDAPTPQPPTGTQFAFVRWSDGVREARREIAWPSRDTIREALFRPALLPALPEDSDDDGVSDVDEEEAATDPEDPERYPSSTLSVTRVAGAVRFTKPGLDTLTLAGTLPEVPAALEAEGVLVRVEVAGAEVPFVLDAKGKGLSQQGTLKFTGTAFERETNGGSRRFIGGSASFTAILKRGDWAGVWTDYGLLPASGPTYMPLLLPVRVRLGGRVFETEVSVLYLSRSAASGSIKGP